MIVYIYIQALIFVVDSADEERLQEAKLELDKLMGEEQLQDSILLIYANKQDMPEALSVQQIADTLELNQMQGRVWYIQARHMHIHMIVCTHAGAKCTGLEVGPGPRWRGGAR